ncbi:MAG: hypothetical protein V2I51_15890 [Anderseniella sp.]|jgi:hypothetical protein|nr:hypothetical protein [Anderseniella sp.]
MPDPRTTMERSKKTNGTTCITAEQFRLIGDRGLGNPAARVAHACAYFEGNLYMGTTHGSGDSPGDCGRILRHRCKQGQWQTVYTSPLRQPDLRSTAIDVLRYKRKAMPTTQVPVHRGFRGMAVFQGKSDSRPALYVSTISNWGGVVLRSSDGENFEPVSAPGLGDDQLLSFRALVPFRGRLFTTPIGYNTGDILDRNGTNRPVVMVSDDPANGRWEEASPAGFGDPRNQVVFNMAVLGDHLYAGTGNPQGGFDVWRTEADGKPPFSWERALTTGAGRFNLNESVCGMVEFCGALYIGTGLPGLGYDSANDVGPAAAVLLRLRPDGSWDLVVGQPRFSPDGLKVPISLMGPGFDDFHNSVIWRMAVHDGWLYLGTHHWEIFNTSLDDVRNPQGGFHLWATRNGEDWQPVTQNGFGSPYAVGVRTLVSTPHGLVIGSDDHSQLKRRSLIASGRTPAQLEGFDDEGGLQVWLGEGADHPEGGPHG